MARSVRDGAGGSDKEVLTSVLQELSLISLIE